MSQAGLIKTSIFAVLLVIIAILGAYFYLRSAHDKYSDVSRETMRLTGHIFGLPKKSPHYEGNSPAHGSVLAAPPINVVVDVDFDLSPLSSMTISWNGVEYGVGDTKIDANKLAMRRDMDSAAPDGKYVVLYNACWPDGSCHDGNFEFVIDRTQLGNFIDQRNKKEVDIMMKNIAFDPRAIRVSRGTRVTWINDDIVDHYVNTDPHPGHTYFPEQNSKIIGAGDTFSLVFDKAGVYAYHCSLHADVMTGVVVVE